MELLDQQTKAIDKLHRLKVGALFMEPGTGKTRTAYELVKSVKSDFILWLTPFQTKQNLLDEINKCGGLDMLEIVGIETLSSSSRVYLELIAKLQSRKTFLIVDESLKIKNWEAIRTKRILQLSNLCEYKLVLNGTPITRNLLDVWAQFEFLSPKILNMGIAEFKNTFCEWVKITKRHNGRTSTQEFISKYHNVDYLYSLIKHYVYECDLELTIEQQHKDITYALGEAERETYNELKAKYLDNEKLKFLNNNIFLEMTMKMQHEYCCTENKFEQLEKLLKETDVSRVIVYTKYIVSRLALQKRFPDMQVLSYGKHSLGLNLQKYNTTVYFDKTFDYSQMTQSKFRTYRTGQEDNCLYYSMTGDVGLEKMINDNIQKKQSLLDYFKKVGAEQIKKEL
jgi:SNF2 family DNA or RNA helicase